MTHPQVKACTRCGHQGSMFKDFEDWDSFCKACRAEVGPRKKRPAREAGSHVVRRNNPAAIEISMPPRKIPPKQVLA